MSVPKINDMLGLTRVHLKRTIAVLPKIGDWFVTGQDKKGRIVCVHKDRKLIGYFYTS